MQISKILILNCFIAMAFILPASASNIGYSGMAQIDNDSYLVVHDKKNHKNGTRVAILKIRNNKAPKYLPVEITDWKHPDGQSSDLESVCSIPEKKNEFLIAESGYWEGKYGRIFHIKLSGLSASVKHVYQLPQIRISSKTNPDGDNFEGILCVKKGGELLVVLGERGGSKAYRNGLLRMGVLDEASNTLSWDKYIASPIEIKAPGKWNEPENKRSISDLYLDKKKFVWAVATEDKSDEGPFKSIIYKAAVISEPDDTPPLNAIEKTTPSYTVAGFKIESLAGPTPLIKGCFMTFATEDESYTGSWRPLFEPVE